MTFESDLAKFTKDATNDIIETVEKSFAEAADVVVDATPVDTGHAKGNWVASTNSPVLEEFDKLDVTGTPTKQAAGIPIKIGHTAYFVNNVPYIQHIEFGTSKVPARPMVAQATNQWAAIVAKNMRR